MFYFTKYFVLCFLASSFEYFRSRCEKGGKKKAELKSKLKSVFGLAQGSGAQKAKFDKVNWSENKRERKKRSVTERESVQAR